MPCDSSYLNATNYEVEISQVACLLDELAGKKWKANHWDGYHPDVYGKILESSGDKMVRKLCDALQERDVKQYSLEMQTWWRDHLIADRDRLERELRNEKTKADRKAALAKLTPHERKVLDLT